MAASQAVQIPTVTLDDLKRFHAAHFPSFPIPDISIDASNGSEAYAGTHNDEALNLDAGEEEEEEDDLRYYPDGVKRTLTDEQIAMFRHSEIQTLLRARRLRDEASDGASEEGEFEDRARDRSPSRKRSAVALSSGTRDGSVRKKKKKKYRKPRPPKGERGKDMKDREAALMDHHRARVLQALQEGDLNGAEEDFTPRRIARELDEVEATTVNVDYG